MRSIVVLALLLAACGKTRYIEIGGIADGPRTVDAPVAADARRTMADANHCPAIGSTGVRCAMVTECGYGQQRCCNRIIPRQTCLCASGFLMCSPLVCPARCFDAGVDDGGPGDGGPGDGGSTSADAAGPTGDGAAPGADASASPDASSPAADAARPPMADASAPARD